MFKTGYFGRASEHGLRGCVSRVHLVYAETNMPICSYKPHNTMTFQWCSVGAHLPYVKCKACLARYAKLLQAEAEKAKALAGINKKYRIPEGVLK